MARGVMLAAALGLLFVGLGACGEADRAGGAGGLTGGEEGLLHDAMKRRAVRRLHSFPKPAVDGEKKASLRDASEDQRLMREKLGLSVPEGGRCNETQACEACDEQSMQDQTDYCLATGWRRVLSCQAPGGKHETHFVSCASQLGGATGPWAVAQMEVMCAVLLTGALYFIRHRKRTTEGKMGGRYTPMTAV